MSQNIEGVPIQIVSDIHLEFENVDKLMPQIQPKAPLLALLGDIGNPFQNNYEQFLNDLSTKFHQLIVVLGNHEFYDNEYFETKEKVKEICSKKENICFLDGNETLLYTCPTTKHTIRILGCTLWTFVPIPMQSKISFILNDYYKIKIKDKNNIVRNLELRDTLKFHEEQVNWIKEMKELYKNETICLLTHHSPYLNGTVLPDEEQFACAMASDLSYLLQDSNITFAGFGHTHKNVRIYLENKNSKNGKTFIVSNALGYITYKENTIIPFNESEIFEIPLINY